MVDCALVLLLVTLFVANTIYGLASPFLPTVLEDKEISSVWTGIIFASYAVASTFTSIITGMVLEKYGHNRIIMLGAFLMAAAIASFGFIEDLDAKKSVISLAIGLRMLQGKCLDRDV